MQVVTISQAGAPGAGGQPLFVDFVNTLHWYEGVPVELIGSPADLATWLDEHHLPAAAPAAALPALLALRERLRAITEALANRRQPPEADLDAVTAALRSPSGHLVWSARVGFATDAPAVDVVACQLALSLVSFLEAGPRHRLKLCANPGCGFAFVDTSINATRRWCFMRYCGNRLKARAFRTRSRRVAPRRASVTEQVRNQAAEQVAAAGRRDADDDNLEDAHPDIHAGQLALDHADNDQRNERQRE
jgi:predicted RNA-binding Zn ribbon-like protein